MYVQTPWIGTNPLLTTNIAASVRIGLPVGSTSPAKLQLVNETSRNLPADYVFAPEYKLAFLSEVELFVKSNHHLQNPIIIFPEFRLLMK